MRVRPLAVATLSAVALFTAAGPAHATDAMSCILNLDTGSLTCGTVAQPPAMPMAASYLLATLYTNADYGGADLALYAATPCDTNSDVDHSWSTLPAGIADEVSSFKGTNNCQVKLFENTGYTGKTIGPVTSTTYVGDDMNDKASSVQLS